MLSQETHESCLRNRYFGDLDVAQPPVETGDRQAASFSSRAPGVVVALALPFAG